MRLLVTGSGGLLGGYLVRHLAGTRHTVLAWTGSSRPAFLGISQRAIDLCDADAVRAAWHQDRPDAVIHTAALSRLPNCHANPVRAQRVNVGATALLAQLASEQRVRLVAVSTDLVFDGEKGHYSEDDPPAPLSVYGQSKLDGERAALYCPTAAVVRVSLLFGPSLNDRLGFFDGQIQALRGGGRVTLFADEWRTPLSLAVAARALTALAESDVTGVLHLGGPQRLSRLEMGRILAEKAGLDGKGIEPGLRSDAVAVESRPRDTSLDSQRWRKLFPAVAWPNYADALEELLPTVR